METARNPIFMFVENRIKRAQLRQQRNRRLQQSPLRNHLLSGSVLLLLSAHTGQAYYVLAGSMSDFAWISWDFLNVFSFAFLATLFFVRVTYQEAVLKLASFALACIGWWSLAALFVLSFISESMHAAWFATFPVLSGSAAVYAFRKYARAGETPITTREDCYLRYAEPKRLQGLLAVALGYRPGGGCSLIVGTKEFCFSHGEVIEREHTFSTSGAIYERIGQIEIDAARRLVGEKWNLWSNCFNVFPRFAKREGAL